MSYMKQENCFRPLSGYLISKFWSKQWKVFRCQRFRPLSGYLISKFDKVQCDTKIASDNRFRPLSGYLISKFKLKFRIWWWVVCFRPLSGYLISKSQSHDRYETATFVSVPSRGILFPNRMKRYIFLNLSHRFPSPLGVSYFQINRFVIVSMFYSHTLFPSPLGVSYFQILEK